MSKYTSYTTKAGDRWDLIAYDAYGKADEYFRIMEANPHAPVRSELPPGLKLNIPVLEPETLSNELLPPWKR